ncbi:MAG: hypothetical protein ACRDZ5_05020, partial [Acidimicrobiales bacterium]
MTPPSRRLRDRITPADGWYVLVLAILPALINLPWAFAGRPLMGGDNLSQNYPLRVLVGQFLAHGQLPLWNPDIWSGAPLLAGWNAGAMYPGTWLFAVLPGIAAWELNLIFTAAMAGIGMHVFLRTQRCTPLASFLGGLVFTYTGFMSGQAVHLGLYEGMSFAPFILVAIELMSRRDRLKDMGGPIALLAVSAGLAVLSGDPRAPSNCAVAAAVFLLARLWRSRSKAPRLLAGFVVAILLAALLAAPQWLPGLAFLHVSQRSAGSVGWYSAGSLRISQLSYFVVPFLFGGNHNFGLPGFAGTYNLPELTYGAGIVSLVALVVCSLRLMSRRHRHTSPTGIFVAMFIVGVLLSLGTTTPLGHLLAHVPLFGGERLQNRNSAVADLALSCLLAIFVDSLRPGAVPVAADGAGSRRRRPNMLARGERVVALLPALCAAGLIAAIYLATRAVEGWLQASHFTLSLPEGSTPYYVAVLAIALSVVAVVLWPHFGRRLTQRRLASGLVVADVLLFLMMASYQPAPPGSLAASNSATRALLAAGAASGRMAIFDPQQTPVRDPPFLLDDVGSNDLVILHHLRSVQGYGSIVSNAYEALTGAHEVLNLRPSALRGQTLDALNLRVLVTLPSLFGSVQPGPFTARLPSGPPLPPGSAAIDREPGDVVDFHSYPPSGPWRLSAVQPTVFELAAPVVIDGLSLRVGARANRTVSLRIALESGAVLSLRVHT